MTIRAHTRRVLRITCLAALAAGAPALNAQTTKPPTLVLVTNGGDGTVSIFDAMSAPRLVATVPVGKDPRELCVAPDGNHAYILNRGDNSISVIDLASMKT